MQPESSCHVYFSYPDMSGALVYIVLGAITAIAVALFAVGMSKRRRFAAGGTKRQQLIQALLIAPLISVALVWIALFNVPSMQETRAFDGAIDTVEGYYHVEFDENQRESIKKAISVGSKDSDEIQPLGTLQINEIGPVESGFSVANWKAQKGYMAIAGKGIYINADISLYYNDGNGYIPVSSNNGSRG